MAEGRTQIIVALIGVCGVVSAALIATAGNVFGPRAAERTPAPVPSLAAQAAVDAPTPAATSVPRIGGWWHDSEGNRFDFSQSGTQYSFVQYSGETQVGGGSGTLTGHDFSHSFQVNDFGSGTCRGSVSGDGRTSSGRCTAPGRGEWSFTVQAGYGP